MNAIQNKMAGVAVAVVCITSAAWPADLTLAEAGKSDYQIVLPDEASAAPVAEALRRAARLMQAAFKANGADLPVVAESARDPDRPGICLGATGVARDAGVDLSDLAGWSYIHRAVGRDLIIAGNDQATAVRSPDDPGLSPDEQARLRRVQKHWTGSPFWPRVGTVKGVCDFLRKHVGVRFLFPDLGDTLADADDIDLAATPALEFLPMPVVKVPADINLRQTVWLDFNVARSRGSFYHLANNWFPLHNTWYDGHAHQYAVPADLYYDSHPEYFAALRTGARVKGVQYCISNPDFQELLYQFVARNFDAGYDTVFLGQSDGFIPCQCDACAQLYGTGDDWTEKLWILHRDIALRLNESHPDKTVVILSYALTERAPPRTFKRFPPNTMVQVCGTNERDFEKWVGIEIPRGLTAYIYNWCPNQVSLYTPQATPLMLAQQVRRLHAHKVRGICRDHLGPYLFGLEGPAIYVMNRMWDDPASNSAAALMGEFVTAAFGPAAAPMRRFYDRLYHAVELYANFLGTRMPAWAYLGVDGRGRKYVEDPLRMLGALYTPDLLAALDLDLTQAEKAADRDKSRARLALVRREFDFLRHLMAVVRFYHAHQLAPDNRPLLELLLHAIDERNLLIAAYYGADKRALPPHPAWRATLFPAPAHDAAHLRLAYNTYQGAFKDTVLNWDTQVMRGVALGISDMTIRFTPGPVAMEGVAWTNTAAVALAGSSSGGDERPEPCTLRALCDATNLYLLFDCGLAVPTSLVAEAKCDLDAIRRHGGVELCLAPMPETGVFYRFAVRADGMRYAAATGLIADPMHPRHGLEDPDWSGAWDCIVHGTPETSRWRALLVIPFKTLGVPAPAGHNYWQGNFGCWSAVDRGKTWSGAGGMDDRNSFGIIRFQP